MQFSEINWQYFHFNSLSNLALYNLLKLRIEVFVVEQNCAYLETDSHDCHHESVHLIGFYQGEIVAAARILPAGLTYATPSIGRVVVAAKAREHGLGHQLMKRAIEHCQQLWPQQAITIGAQHHLRQFYQTHQFQTISEPYDEDGILHIDMQRKANLYNN